jgi:DDE family transposase
MPYKVNEKRRHRIPKARYRVQNWRDYDAALRRRGDLTIWVTAEAIEAWTPASTGQRGRPQLYSAIAVETGLMLRLAFGRPWRHTEGMLASILRLLGMDLPVPDHTTFSRRSADLTVAKAVRTATGPVNVVIDSTGLKVFGAGEWQREKHGGKGHRTWRKLHLAVDLDTGEIVASELTTAEDGDASQVGPLLDQISGPIASVTADGAYDGEPV